MKLGKFEISFRKEKVAPSVVSVVLPNDERYDQYYFDEIFTEEGVLKIWYWSDEDDIGNRSKLKVAFYAPGEWKRIFTFYGHITGF